MNVGMAEPEWNNNEVGQEEREDLSKGREKCAPLSLIFPGQCFCFRSSPPTYALLIPAVQSQFELCKRINSFDSWMGHSPRRVQKVVDTAVKRPIIKGIYDRFFSRTPSVSGSLCKCTSLDEIDAFFTIGHHQIGDQFYDSPFKFDVCN